MRMLRYFAVKSLGAILHRYYLKVSFELLHFVHVLCNLVDEPIIAWVRNKIQILIHGNYMNTLLSVSS